MVKSLHNIRNKKTSNIPDNPNVNPPNPRLPPIQTTGAMIQLTSSKIYVPNF